MVRLVGNYVVDVDTYEYTLKIDKHKTTVDKNGVTKNVYDCIGHYSSLEGAIKGAIKHMNRIKLSEGVHTLECALKMIQQSNEEFADVLERVVKEND